MTSCGHELTRVCDGCTPEHLDRFFNSPGRLANVSK